MSPAGHPINQVALCLLIDSLDNEQDVSPIRVCLNHYVGDVHRQMNNAASPEVVGGFHELEQNAVKVIVEVAIRTTPSSILQSSEQRLVNA